MDDSSTFYRDLCEDSTDLLQSVSLDGYFLYVNRAWRETLGYSLDEITRLRLSDTVHMDSRRWFSLAERHVPGETPIQCAITLKGKDGRDIFTEGILGCHFRNGRPDATYGIFRLDGSRGSDAEQLNRLFNLSQDLLCVAGVDGYFRQINPAFLQILGYTREELLTRSFIEFVHPDDRAGTLEAVEALATGLPVVDFQNRYRARNGSYRWLSWRSTPWAERGLIYAVARDITEQKKMQELMALQAEELARSNADLEQFAYVASHDLRAPLRGVANLAGFLEEDMREELSGKAISYIDKLRDMVQRMEKLTDDILQYSRAGREPDQICLVDTSEMLKELTVLLSPPEGFIIGWDPAMPVFETAKSPLEQVFRNLVGNAVKHRNRNNGAVHVSVEEQPDFYQFSVIDDGPGIPAESREKVFGMFYKLPSGARVESNGIGLALVKRLVESRGGRVWIDPAEPSGAAFRFTWPKSIESSGGSRAGDSDR